MHWKTLSRDKEFTGFAGARLWRRLLRGLGFAPLVKAIKVCAKRSREVYI